MEQSIRQQRRAKRATKRDKWGYSMTLSRAQRRAQRRQDSQNAKKIDGRVNTFLQPSQIATDPVSGHVHHHAGSLNHH